MPVSAVYCKKCLEFTKWLCWHGKVVISQQKYSHYWDNKFIVRDDLRSILETELSILHQE